VNGSRYDQRVLAVALALFGLSFIAYLPVGSFDFVYYDDPEYVFDNPTVRTGLTPWGIVWAFVDAHVANWHPVTWLSHMLDCELFGLDPGAHHLVSALVHSANGALLFLVLRSLTGALWRSSVAAALFAFHPLRVESVAWISERKDVLSGFFFLLTIWAYAAYCRRAAPRPSVHPPQNCSNATGLKMAPKRAGGLFYLALGCFLLGLLSKAMLVTVPAVLLLLDYWPLRRLELPGSAGWGSRTCLAWCRNTLWPRIREKLPFFVLSLLVGVAAVFAQHSGSAIVSLTDEGWGGRLGTALSGLSSYLQKTVWPSGLTFLYLRPQHPQSELAAAGLALIAGFLFTAFRNLCRRPYLLVGGLWFLLMLLPVCGLLQVGLQATADRYTYLPSIGLAIIMAWGVGDILARSGARVGDSASFKNTPAKLLSVGLAILVLATFLLLTRHQLSYWQNTEVLMGRALELDSGNYIAHQNLALVMSKQGRFAEARQHREEALRLDAELRAVCGRN
jgi:hypothetical protein